MSYLVFARKFRPQTFDEVVGQEPIVTTLKNAIGQNRIPQNFLFSGPRGIGKTSTARILAKALNCAKGPTPEPCGKCAACGEITQTNSLDVLEIDGASNRGIDEIRNLRETVKFKPVTCGTKIYIIDEVHMLTSEAFNALLKTLEEPPPHIKFIFATTEPHKVPLTILSRCQRFHFKRIPTAEIMAKLQEIARIEKLKFEPGALYLLAKASEGSLRDAEGLLDQLASFSEKKMTEGDVLMMLGLASEDLYFSVLSGLRAQDAQKIFTLVQELYNEGKDLIQFARGLLELFRDLLLFQCTPEARKFVEMSEEGIRELEKRKNDFSRGELLLALSLLGNLQNQLRRNLASPRLLVETALLKLLHLDGLKTLDEVPDAGEERTAPPVSSAPAKTVPFAPAGKKERPASRREKEPSPPVSKKTPSSAAESGSASIETIQEAWPRVIEYVKSRRMSSGIFLSESEPVELNHRVVTLALPSEFQFHKDMLEKDTNRKLVEEAFGAVVGEGLRVQFVVAEAEHKERPVAKGDAAGREPAGVSEIITEALNVFEGGKIVRKE